MYNALGQSPCVVYAYVGLQLSQPHQTFQLISFLRYLSSVCATDGNWVVVPPGNATYDPPTTANASVCQCNTVAYSLMEACSFCQGSHIGTWRTWITNCPEASWSKAYANTVPSETVIPPWALLDPTLSGSWSASRAKKYVGKSSRTGEE